MLLAATIRDSIFHSCPELNKLHHGFSLDQVFPPHLLSVFLSYYIPLRKACCSLYYTTFSSPTLLIKKKGKSCIPPAVICCSVIPRNLSIQASCRVNLHKPVTALLYHLIGPQLQRHLNMQIIQKTCKLIQKSY